MKIAIDIPKEFEDHFNLDRFADSLERIQEDMTFGDKLFTLSGLYEYETIVMFKKAFQESKPLIECKDCKYYKPMQELDDDGNVTFTYDNGACTRGIEWHREWEAVTGEDYCSKGERRETECKP